MTKSSILAKDIEIYSVFCKIARRRRKILAKDIEIYGIFCQRARRRRKILGFTLFLGKFMGGDWNLFWEHLAIQKQVLAANAANPVP